MPLTEGESYVSFDALNLWASKREFEISPNRIETQNSRLLNLWGREFVISFTAVAAVKRAALECIINIHMYEIVLKHLYINLIHVEQGITRATLWIVGFTGCQSGKMPEIRA